MPAVLATLIREHISIEWVHVIVFGRYADTRHGTDGAAVLVTSLPVVDALAALAQLFDPTLQWIRVDSVRVCE